VHKNVMIIFSRQRNEIWETKVDSVGLYANLPTHWPLYQPFLYCINKRGRE